MIFDSTILHYKILQSLKENEFEADILIKCKHNNSFIDLCPKINKRIPSNQYKGYQAIQIQLLCDDKFISLFENFIQNKQNIERLNTVLGIFQENDRNITDYNVSQLYFLFQEYEKIDIHQIKNIWFGFLDYCKSTIESEQYKFIFNNLNKFYSFDKRSNHTINLFTEETRERFFQLDLSSFDINEYTGFNRKDIENICTDCNQRFSLFHILMIPYQFHFKFKWSKVNYEEICKNDNKQIEQISLYLEKIVTIFESESEIMSKFFHYWTDYGCQYNHLVNYLNGIELQQKNNTFNVKEVLDTPLHYLNALFENKFSKLLFKWGIYKFNLLEYAFLNNKQQFLSIICKHIDDFSNFDYSKSKFRNSYLLFQTKLYEYLDMDSLDFEKIKFLSTECYYEDSFNNLKINYCYSFEEIQILLPYIDAKDKEKCINFYHLLKNDSINKRIEVFTEVAKYYLGSELSIEDEESKALIDSLLKNTLSNWKIKTFNHINNITDKTVFYLLIIVNKYSSLIKTIKEEYEAIYIIENRNTIPETVSNMQELYSNAIKYDRNWTYIINALDIKEDFINENIQILNFLSIRNVFKEIVSFFSKSSNRQLYLDHIKKQLENILNITIC